MGIGMEMGRFGKAGMGMGMSGKAGIGVDPNFWSPSIPFLGSWECRDGNGDGMRMEMGVTGKAGMGMEMGWECLEKQEWGWKWEWNDWKSRDGDGNGSGMSGKAGVPFPTPQELTTVRVQDPRVHNEGSWNSYVDYKIFLHVSWEWEWDWGWDWDWDQPWEWLCSGISPSQGGESLGSHPRIPHPEILILNPVENSHGEFPSWILRSSPSSPQIIPTDNSHG